MFLEGETPLNLLLLPTFAPDFEEDYTLQLLDEDGVVVYSVNCLSGTTQVVLPSTLTGDYEIMVIRGGTYYVGYIEL